MLSFFEVSLETDAPIHIVIAIRELIYGIYLSLRSMTGGKQTRLKRFGIPRGPMYKTHSLGYVLVKLWNAQQLSMKYQT